MLLHATLPRANSFSANAGIDTLHRSYKQRSTARSSKLTKFFGSDPPLDVSIPEIEKQGLKAILTSKVPLAYFLYSLLEDWSCENLFFYLEVEHYNNAKFSTDETHRVAAQHIFDTYLSPNSHFEVNVDERVRKDCITGMSAGKLTGCFDAAKRAVLVLMESSFQKFLKSSIFAQMKREIGSVPFYLSQTRDAAVTLLMSYLDKQGSAFISGESTSSETAIRRHLLVRHMIREYCRTMLEVTVDDNAWDKLVGKLNDGGESAPRGRSKSPEGRTRKRSGSLGGFMKKSSGKK